MSKGKGTRDESMTEASHGGAAFACAVGYQCLLTGYSRRKGDAIIQGPLVSITCIASKGVNGLK